MDSRISLAHEFRLLWPRPCALRLFTLSRRARGLSGSALRGLRYSHSERIRSLECSGGVALGAGPITPERTAVIFLMLPVTRDSRLTSLLSNDSLPAP